MISTLQMRTPRTRDFSVLSNVIYPNRRIQKKKKNHFWIKFAARVPTLHYSYEGKYSSLLLHCIPPPAPDITSLHPRQHCGFEVSKSFGGNQLLHHPGTLVLKQSAVHKAQRGFTSLTLFQQILLIWNCQQSLIYVMCVTVRNSFLLHCPASMGKINK